jgi:hypothetical protein
VIVFWEISPKLRCWCVLEKNILACCVRMHSVLFLRRNESTFCTVTSPTLLMDTDIARFSHWEHPVSETPPWWTGKGQISALEVNYIWLYFCFLWGSNVSFSLIMTWVGFFFFKCDSNLRSTTEVKNSKLVCSVLPWSLFSNVGWNSQVIHSLVTFRSGNDAWGGEKSCDCGGVSWKGFHHFSKLGLIRTVLSIRLCGYLGERMANCGAEPFEIGAFTFPGMTPVGSLAFSDRML